MTADDRRSRGHGAKAEPMRERALLALLTDRSLTAAASRAGIAERTLRRWLAEDEDFRAALAEARKATFNAGIERVQALTGRAVRPSRTSWRRKSTPPCGSGPRALSSKLL